MNHDFAITRQATLNQGELGSLLHIIITAQTRFKRQPIITSRHVRV